jgi:protein SCO1/2
MFALILLTSLCADLEPDASRLAVIRTTPKFTLTTQSAEPLRWEDLRGKVVLVSFVFTTCSGSCPATTHRMSQVAQALARTGLLKTDRVRLLSITLDPARDTPEALRKYMKAYDADPASWTFLTGSREHVEQVHAAWGMWAKPAANGQIDHPSRVFLVDSRGRVREIYNLDFFKPAWVLEDVQSLLDETAGGPEVVRAMPKRRVRSQFRGDRWDLIRSRALLR